MSVPGVTEENLRRNKYIFMNFMFMGPCILVYNDHISNQRDAAFCALY